jgi:hypothetical protein
LEAGDSVDIVPLVEKDDILTCDQCAIWLDEGSSPFWVYTGPRDPSHDLKLDKGYRAFMPLMVDGEVKIWSMGKRVHSSLLDIAEAIGSLAGQIIRVKRTGSGFKTAYTVVQRGKRKDISEIEVPDIFSFLGPLTSDGVKDMLVSKFDMPYPKIVEKYKKQPEKKAAPVEEDKDLIDVVSKDDMEDDDDVPF